MELCVHSILLMVCSVPYRLWKTQKLKFYAFTKENNKNSCVNCNLAAAWRPEKNEKNKHIII
jgi:hypothetical protein